MSSGARMILSNRRSGCSRGTGRCAEGFVARDELGYWLLALHTGKHTIGEGLKRSD